MHISFLCTLLRTRPYSTSLAVTTLATAFSILFLDRVVLACAMGLSQVTRSTFNEIAKLSTPEVWIPVFVLGAVSLVILDRAGVGGRNPERRIKRWADAFIFGAASLIVAGIALNILKFVFGRLRPKAYLADGSYGFDPFSFDYSMNALPSGHTQAAITMAFVMLFILPRYDVVYIAFGLLIGACRIIHGNHWLGDVIAGLWLGAVIPIALALWMSRNGRPVCLGSTQGSILFCVGRCLFTTPKSALIPDARDTVVKTLRK